MVAALSHALAGIDTTHSVSNARVTLHGDTATLGALVEAQHVPAADPARHYLMKNRYEVLLARVEERWLIRRITVDNVWRTGDLSVLAGV